MSGVDSCGLAAVSLVGPTFAVFAGATARAGRDAIHPNKRGRAVDVHLSKSYQASDVAARLSGMFPLVGLLTGLVTGCAESG